MIDVRRRWRRSNSCFPTGLTSVCLRKSRADRHVLHGALTKERPNSREKRRDRGRNDDDPKNPPVNFRGQQRLNDTHELDAVVAALTVREFKSGRGTEVGGGDGLGTIVLPRPVQNPIQAVLNWPDTHAQWPLSSAGAAPRVRGRQSHTAGPPTAASSGTRGASDAPPRPDSHMRPSERTFRIDRGGPGGSPERVESFDAAL